MKIGNIDLGEYPALLAPMEKVTDVSFRLLCKKMGAALVCSEFIAADALIRRVNRSIAKLSLADEERPAAVQIYGRDPQTMAEAARIVTDLAQPDIIDLNFGCPVKRIAAKGAGAGLLRDVPRMLAITRAVVAATNIPVTAKTRLGWDDSSKIIPDLAEALQDCGIQALTIHGRTRAQMYSGTADWTLIGTVKANPRMKIPVIGNGDICSAEQARRCFDQYGVDAVMIGRASFGRPWIFKEIADTLRPGSTSPATDGIIQSPWLPMSLDWKIDVLKEQIRSSIRRIGERGGILHIRGHLAATPVFKGIPDFRPMRVAMLRAETQEELFRLIEEARPLARLAAETPPDD